MNRYNCFSFLLISFFNSFTSKFKVSSILAITGFAPQSSIASMVAIKLKDCVITSSPGFTFRAFRAILIAAVPDVTARQFFDPKYFLAFDLNDLT